MPWNLGPLEVVVILLIALFVFGPRKLPELGRSIGSAISEFRRASKGFANEIEGQLINEEVMAADREVAKKSAGGERDV